MANTKPLRRGYTTGACAAAAAKAAAKLLLSGEILERVNITVGAGEELILTLADSRLADGTAICAVKKDAGDDPDITDGMLIYATVRRCDAGIMIEGGEGIGRVTKPGLEQPVGNPAINNGPRRMIERELRKVMKNCEYAGGLTVTVAIPGGEEAAKRTFNPRLGILGGLSVLGTTGIVEPMSEAALIETIRAQISVLAAADVCSLLLTPGNYGADFCRLKLGLSLRGHIKCGNFIADSIEAAAEKGFSNILLVGHIGKLVKVAVGTRNTHSRYGDGRIEALRNCAPQVPPGLEQAVSTEAALDILEQAGILPETLVELGKRTGAQLQNWAGAHTQMEFICFSQTRGLLCNSENAIRLAERWK